MKKLLFLILIAGLVLTNKAFAYSFINSPSQYANNTNHENIASGTAIASASGNPGTGYQLGPGDSGYYILDYGGQTAGSTLTGSTSPRGTRYVLPLCSSSALGYQFSIATAVQETITITPYSTADSIAYSISGSALKAGQGMSNTIATGASVAVQCGGNGTWNIQGISGSWNTSN